MRLFKAKSHRQHKPAEGSLPDRAAHAMARAILHSQEKAARFLGRKFMGLSRRARQGSLILFCLLYGGSCLWLLGQSLFDNPRPAAAPAVQMTQPGRLEKPAREKASLQPVEGRHLRDSLLQASP